MAYLHSPGNSVDLIFPLLLPQATEFLKKNLKVGDINFNLFFTIHSFVQNTFNFLVLCSSLLIGQHYARDLLFFSSILRKLSAWKNGTFIHTTDSNTWQLGGTLLSLVFSISTQLLRPMDFYFPDVFIICFLIYSCCCILRSSLISSQLDHGSNFITDSCSYLPL